MGMITVPYGASSEDLAGVVDTFQNHSDIDVVIGCTYYNTCVRFMQEAKKKDYSPKAISMSSCVDSSAFEVDLGEDGAYVLGPAVWHKAQAGIGNLTGRSAASWNAEYLQRYAEEPPYQGATLFCAGLIVVDAIERAQSLNSTKIMDVLRDDYIGSTICGEITFDANMQNAMPSKVVQRDLALDPYVVYPPAMASSEIIFPMPSWRMRTCWKTHNCNLHGTCEADGSCTCEKGFGGDECENIVLNVNSTLNCPVGHYCFAYGGQIKASECPTGYYQALTGQAFCASCPAGRYSDTAASEDCNICAAGRYGPEPSMARCLACQEGYTELRGQQQCDPCPANTRRVFGSSGANRTDCVCNEGFVNYAGDAGSACAACPEGGACTGKTDIGTALSDIHALEGWWRTDRNSDKFYECLASSWIEVSVPMNDTTFRTSRQLDGVDGKAGVDGTPSGALHLRRLAKKRSTQDANGGAASLSGFIEHVDCPGGPPSIPCSNVTRDVLCHRCIDGYVREKVPTEKGGKKKKGGRCVPCGENTLSGDVVWACIMVPLALIFVLLTSKYLTMNDLSVMAIKESIRTHLQDDKTEAGLHIVRWYKRQKTKAKAKALDERAEKIKNKHKRGAGIEVAAYGGAGMYATAGMAENANGGSDDDEAQDAEDALADEMTSGDNIESGESQKMMGDKAGGTKMTGMATSMKGSILKNIRKNFGLITNQLKIVLTWMQCLTAISVVFPIKWPPLFSQLLEALYNVVNIEILSLFSNLECELRTDFLASFRITMSLVPCMAVLLMLTYAWASVKHNRALAKEGFANMNYSDKSLAIRCFKLLLIVIFFCYPGITTKVECIAWV
jgi:hypothetical protein